MGDEPRITLTLLKVLSVMLENPDEEHYGLEVAKAAGLPSGTLYPLLRRLERFGWLDSGWEDIDPAAEGRPPRRYYRLTESGQVRAKAAMRKVAAHVGSPAGALA